jgi:hypothetical protein
LNQHNLLVGLLLVLVAFREVNGNLAKEVVIEVDASSNNRLQHFLAGLHPEGRFPSETFKYESRLQGLIVRLETGRAVMKFSILR